MIHDEIEQFIAKTFASFRLRDDHIENECFADVARQYAKVHDYAEGHPLHRSQQPHQPQFPADSPYNYLTGYSEAETKWRQSREVMVKIRVPRGARYLAGDSESAELILNRGSRFRVLRAGRDSDGRMAYEMELLP